MSFVCGCVNPACMAHGCQRAAIEGQRFPFPTYSPNPPGPRPGQTVVLSSLSEEDVRRIIREELAKAKP